MSTKRIIEESIAKNPVSLKEVFSSLMKQKLAEQLMSEDDDGLKVSHSGLKVSKSSILKPKKSDSISVSNESVEEEVETLDELSKDTLISYAIKAHRKGDMAARMSKSGDDKDMANYANKRYQGVQNALKQIAVKEDIEDVSEAKEESPIAGTRKISTHQGKDGHHAEVRFNKDWDEYSVHHYDNGKHMGEKPVSYHGGGKEGKADATETAEHAVKNFRIVNGKLKMNEEAELEESITKLSHARLKFHATKNVPHGSYTKAEIKDEHNRRLRTEPDYVKAKASLNEEIELEEGNAENKLKKNVFTAKLGNKADVTRSNYSDKELKPLSTRYSGSRDSLKNAVSKMLRAGRAELKHGKDAGFVQTLNDFGKDVREEAELEEKVTNPYAVGMAAAMKSTGDKPPLKKSTIIKAHDIAKAIKNEDMDKVGKEEVELDEASDPRRVRDELKSQGKHREAGEHAFKHDLGRSYGPHFGMRSSKNSAEMEYHKGYDYAKARAQKADRLKNEEVEQIDEISVDKMQDYHYAAKQNRAGNDAVIMGRHPGSDAKAYADNEKRKKGLDMARKKIHNALLKKEAVMDKVGKEDADIDNDGDVDKSDSYLHNRRKAIAKAIKEEVESLDEVSKATLASYIKKASHDVATKSAATGRYAERANKEADHRKETGDMSKYRQGREDDAKADKFFKQSWKRREGIAKAADKLSKD